MSLEAMDPLEVASLLDRAPFALYGQVVPTLLAPDATVPGLPTVSHLEAGIRAGRLAALPADVRDRLARYVRERVAARLGL